MGGNLKSYERADIDRDCRLPLTNQAISVFCRRLCSDVKGENQHDDNRVKLQASAVMENK